MSQTDPVSKAPASRTEAAFPATEHPAGEETSAWPGCLTVVGESLVDILTGSGGGPAKVLPGGSPLNVAVGCARLAMATSFVTHYGQDDHGDTIAAHLSANGVDPIVGGTSPTSIARATLDATGAAEYDFDITWDLTGATLPAASAVENSQHLHTGSIAAVLPSGNETVYALIAAARRQASVSYDPNCRPSISPDVDQARRQAEKFVAASDIVKASNEDLQWLYPGRPIEQTVAAWLKLGPGLVAVTRGSAGPVLATRQTTVTLPAEPVHVADTVGAGDSFMAGMLSGLAQMGFLGYGSRDRLRHLSSDALLCLARYANRAAAITCSRAGANPPWTHELGALQITAPSREEQTC